MVSGAIGSAPTVELSFQQTVPCDIAHRRALGEVFVADSVQTGQDEFVLALQLPRAHSVWFDRRVRYHDPLSTAEASRQAVFVVMHRHLGIPRELAFTLEQFSCTVLDVEAYRDDERTPLEALIRYRVGNRHALSSELGSMRFDGEVFIGGRPALLIGARIVAMPDIDTSVLRALQTAGTAGPGSGGDTVEPQRQLVEATEVGRRDGRNVVLARQCVVDGQAGYPLVLDQGHPSFFDHCYDHLPGPVAVEAMRQAALLSGVAGGQLPGPDVAVVSVDVTFSNFGYLDAPLYATAGPSDGAAPVAGRLSGAGDGSTWSQAGQAAFDIALRQFGRPIVRGVITFGRYPE